jgi:small subunit ribosomal protein S21
LGYKKKFHKRKPKERKMMGLSVPVYHNNVELALKKLKRKVKNSGILLDLKRHSYYEKPSKVKREKKNLAKLRNKYAVEKENN